MKNYFNKFLFITGILAGLLTFTACDGNKNENESRF